MIGKEVIYTIFQSHDGAQSPKCTTPGKKKKKKSLNKSGEKHACS